MQKVQKLIKFLILLIKKPSLINLISNSDYYWTQYLLKKKPKKIQLNTIQFNDLFTSKTQFSLEKHLFSGGGSSPLDLILLKELSKTIPNCSYFEIGTWRGESAINLTKSVKEIYTLNLSENEMINLNLPQKYAFLQGELSQNYKHINHLYGDSKQFDFKSLNKKFDLIFIDGNHTYDYIKSDSENVFKHLIHEKSIVVWHDYCYHPEKVRPEVLAGILDGVPKKFVNTIYHVSNTNCAIFFRDEVKNSFIEFPSKTKISFKLKLEIE